MARGWQCEAQKKRGRQVQGKLLIRYGTLSFHSQKLVFSTLKTTHRGLGIYWQFLNKPHYLDCSSPSKKEVVLLRGREDFFKPLGKKKNFLNLLVLSWKQRNQVESSKGIIKLECEWKASNPKMTGILRISSWIWIDHSHFYFKKVPSSSANFLLYYWGRNF